MTKSYSKMLKAGIAGTIIFLICCFTPVLVVLFGAVGLSAVVGWLDYILIPALIFFILLTIYAFFKQRNTAISQ